MPDRRPAPELAGLLSGVGLLVGRKGGGVIVGLVTSSATPNLDASAETLLTRLAGCCNGVEGAEGVSCGAGVLENDIRGVENAEAGGVEGAGSRGV